MKILQALAATPTGCVTSSVVVNFPRLGNHGESKRNVKGGITMANVKGVGGVCAVGGGSMGYTYWRGSSGMWLGYLDAYPEYPTQGRTISELERMLVDILGAVRDNDLADTRANRMRGVLAVP